MRRDANNLDISVVIPAYNEEKLIVNCLDSLIRQETSKAFEVIVVNNNSTDRTQEILEGYKTKLNLKIIFEERKSRGRARYAGFKHAAADIVLSTDADAVVPNDWIERMTAAFEKDMNISAVTGSGRIVDCSSLVNGISYYFLPILMKTYRIFVGHYWLNGFNFAIRKDAYNKAGGFNPAFNAEEDIDLSFRVSKIGKIKFLEDLFVIVSGRRFHRGLLYGLWQYIYTSLSYHLFHKDVYLDDQR